MLAAAERGTPGEVYNVGASNEWPNLEIVKTILWLMDRPEDLIRYVKDRPGHDRRYAIDSSKAQRELGWRPAMDFGAGLRQTVDWFLKNEPWWRAVMSGEYLSYYEKNYAGKIALFV